MLKKHGEKIFHPTVRIYTNKKENRIMFKIKIGYYLELEESGSLIQETSETIKNKTKEKKNLFQCHYKHCLLIY